MRGMRRKTTTKKRIMQGSKSLVIWEHGFKHRHARTKRDNDDSEGAGGVLVWVQCAADEGITSE